MAINGKQMLLFLALVLVFIANTNSSPTLNRLLRLRDENRGIGNGKLLCYKNNYYETSFLDKYREFD